ncbi:hypothetical protein TNCV_3962421 [Trichonephila clavipes]|nr:hypothetical protein TNCV_3962421 [Trichonephila clavipes]
MNGVHEQRYRTTLCLLTNSASTCNITMVGFEFGDTVGVLNSHAMHRHTGPAPGIMVWVGIGFQYHNLLVRLVSTLSNQRDI